MTIKALQSAINRSGLSQAEICRRAAIRPTTICDVYNGKRAPRLATIARIAIAIGADPDALIEAVRAPESPAAPSRPLPHDDYVDDDGYQLPLDADGVPAAEVR